MRAAAIDGSLDNHDFFYFLVFEGVGRLGSRDVDNYEIGLTPRRIPIPTLVRRVTSSPETSVLKKSERVVYT